MSVYLEMQIDEMADEMTALKAINQKLQLEKNALKEQLALYGVSNCNDKKGSEFEDWLKKQNLKEVVTKEYKWREFVLDEEFVLAKFNEDKHR